MQCDSTIIFLTKQSPLTVQILVKFITTPLKRDFDLIFLDLFHQVAFKISSQFRSQVSHHPPISAIHVESDKWVFWQEYKLDTRFRGVVGV